MISEPPALAGAKLLLDRVREAIRIRHLSPRTERAYVHWIGRYLGFHGLRDAADLGEDEVTRFLSHLALSRHVAAATQNQAFNALLFLYRSVLNKELGAVDARRAKRPHRFPVVLSTDEVRRLLGQLEDPVRLVCRLLYGAGLRLLECLRLRAPSLLQRAARGAPPPPANALPRGPEEGVGSSAASRRAGREVPLR